jgi:hypothetical protein
MADQYKYTDFYLAVAGIIPLLYVALILQGAFIGAFSYPFRMIRQASLRALGETRRVRTFSVRWVLAFLKYIVASLASTYLFYAGALIVGFSAFSEYLSLGALKDRSDSVTRLNTVFISVVGLLVLMVIPAVGTLFSKLASAGSSEQVKTHGIGRLRAANRDEEARSSVATRESSEQQEDTTRRDQLHDKGLSDLKQISHTLREAITKAAPLATATISTDIGWTISLNGAKLRLASPTTAQSNPWELGFRPAFKVITFSSIHISTPEDTDGYIGRSHSLWYCDAFAIGQFVWLEVAFMPSVYPTAQVKRCPFELDPSPSAAQAFGPGSASIRLARRPRIVRPKVSRKFIDRWAGWFADGAQGQLDWPTPMPEEFVLITWRQN